MAQTARSVRRRDHRTYMPVVGFGAGTARRLDTWIRILKIIWPPYSIAATPCFGQLRRGSS